MEHCRCTIATLDRESLAPAVEQLRPVLRTLLGAAVAERVVTELQEPR